jgi:hypothetical protein
MNQQVPEPPGQQPQLIPQTIKMEFPAFMMTENMQQLLQIKPSFSFKEMNCIHNYYFNEKGYNINTLKCEFIIEPCNSRMKELCLQKMIQMDVIPLDYYQTGHELFYLVYRRMDLAILSGTMRVTNRRAQL